MNIATASRIQQWDRVVGWFVAVLLILIPLSVPVGPRTLNVQWSDVAALGIIASAAAAGIWRRSRLSACFWAVLYVGSLLPSLVHSTHQLSSWVAVVKTVYLVCLGLTLAQWARASTAWDYVVHVFAFVVAAMIILTLAIWGYTMWSGHIPANLAVLMEVPNVGRMVRVKATLLTPTFLANYLTMGVPMLAGYAAAHAHRPRVASWAVLAAGLLAVGTTASHSAAGCLVAAALIASRTTWWDRLGQRCLSLLAIAAVLFSLVSTTVSLHEIRMTNVPETNSSVSMVASNTVIDTHEFLGPSGAGQALIIQIHYAWVSYALLKRFAWEAWQHHPWLGIGLGEFPRTVTEAFKQGWIHSYYAGGADPHSTWLGAMAETGLIGFLGLLGFWVALLRGNWESRGQIVQPINHWRIRAPFAGLVGLLVNRLHVDVMHFRFLWVGTALLIAAAAQDTMRKVS